MTDLMFRVLLSISLAVPTYFVVRGSWRSWRLKQIEASSRAYWTNQ